MSANCICFCFKYIYTIRAHNELLYVENGAYYFNVGDYRIARCFHLVQFLNSTVISLSLRASIHVYMSVCVCLDVCIIL